MRFVFAIQPMVLSPSPLPESPLGISDASGGGVNRDCAVLKPTVRVDPACGGLKALPLLSPRSRGRGARARTTAHGVARGDTLLKSPPSAEHTT